MKLLSLTIFIVLVSTYAKASELAGMLGERFIARKQWAQFYLEKQDPNQEERREGESDLNKKFITLRHTLTGHASAIAGIIPKELEAPILNAITHFEMFKQKRNELPYHFFITQHGLIYEGRPLSMEGDPIIGINDQSIEVAFLGCYENAVVDFEGKAYRLNTQTLTPEMQEAAASLFACLGKIYDFPINDVSVVTCSGSAFKTDHPTSSGGAAVQSLVDLKRKIIEKSQNFP